MMLTKILVALDHSPMSPTVFSEALELAKALKAEMTLLHVLSRGSAGSPNLPIMPVMDYYPAYDVAAMELFENAWKAYESKGKEMLQNYVSQAQSAGVTVTSLQLDGAPGPLICEQAQQLGAQLIVLGRRGHSGFSELFFGSVSNYALHHAPCSVHVLNAPTSTV
jgi:nucleotide-binding universal stress UspA family protein